MSRRTVEDWRRAVFKSELTGSVKVLLLYLADHMNRSNKHVSIPRKTIAKDLGCHEQRVAERFAAAVKAQYLVNVLSGYTGRTAVYQATWPDPPRPDCVPLTRTQSDNRKSVHSRGGLCTAPQDATTRADLFVVGSDRHVGNEESGAVA